MLPDIWVGKPECIRKLFKARRRCETNFKMDLNEKGFECVGWIDVTH